jgi:hypothetical protein
MEVKNCPRCGSDALSHGWSFPPMTGSVQCFADGCEVIALADTEAEAVAMWNDGRWNYRVTDYNDNGLPVIERAALPPPAQENAK